MPGVEDRNGRVPLRCATCVHHPRETDLQEDREELFSKQPKNMMSSSDQKDEKM